MVPPSPPRPRLVDVADVAGVSMKTVSNVINGYAHVSASTRERVEAAIAQTGYRPNLSARNLARGRSGVIALVVPRLEMPYFAALAACVVEAAEARGWFVLIHQSDGALETELAALEARFPQRIDGIVLSSELLRAEHLAARADTTPLVLLGDHDTGPDVPHVGIDNHAAARLAIGHLAEIGCRRIALIGAAPGAQRHRRNQGFRDGLREAGLDADPALMQAVRANTGVEGERAMEAILASGDTPDGVFALTDWLAFGAIRALHRHGVAVPERTAVIGFDDIPYASSLTPSLTSIAPDRRAIAERAVALLEQQLAGVAESDPEGDRIGFELVVRESTRRG